MGGEWCAPELGVGVRGAIFRTVTVGALCAETRGLQPGGPAVCGFGVGHSEDRVHPLGLWVMRFPLTDCVKSFCNILSKKGPCSSLTSLVFNSLPFLHLLLKLKHSSASPKILSVSREVPHTHLPGLETSEASLWPSSDQSPYPAALSLYTTLKSPLSICAVLSSTPAPIPAGAAH